MDGYLKQATASQVRLIGPFIDDTDFKTVKNALTIANTDILVSQNGGTAAAKNSGGATADGANGMYHLTWDATDTATVGQLAYSVNVSGALVVWGNYTVLEEAIYDALFAASAAGYQVPIWAAANSTVNLSATTVKTVTDAVALPASASIAITGNITGNLSGSVGSVTGAVGSVTGTVGGNVTGSVGSVVGNVGGSVASVTGAVGSVTGNVGGNVVGSVASVAGNVGGNVAGSVASVTAVVSANLTKINNTTVAGDGSGTPWGP